MMNFSIAKFKQLKFAILLLQVFPSGRSNIFDHFLSKYLDN